MDIRACTHATDGTAHAGGSAVDGTRTGRVPTIDSSPTTRGAEDVDCLIVDNYDSFTFNLAQYIAELGANVKVVRNDCVTVEELVAARPRRILLSPGPGHPRDAGITCDVIRTFAGVVPILGVCLGHQAICEVYGGVVEHAGEIVHGKTSPMHHDGKGVFQGLPTPLRAVRYHSLAVRADSLPPTLHVTCRTDNGIIQGVRHVEKCVEGVQFHPESILTEGGKTMLANFLGWTGGRWS